MPNKIYTLLLLLVLAFSHSAKAQYAEQDSSYKKHFIGSTLFLLGNFAATNRPDFAQLNLGRRLSHRDVVSLELKTWKYAWSLGIPYGPDYESPQEKFPGFVREFGFAIAYQRFWWRGLYTGIHVMNAWQSFVDKDKVKIGSGFQIFNTYRLGYHIKLWQDRLFLEPSLAITHRPFSSEMPEGFRQLNDKWPRYFLGEPGFHFGFNF